MSIERAIIVRSKTRLEQLVERFNSKAQAKFYINRSQGNFEYYEQEHDRFYESLETIEHRLQKVLKSKIIDRSFLPNYLFTAQDVVIVVGQDGLVANTAKYVDDLPIIAINPDKGRYDGILLPFGPTDFDHALFKVLESNYHFQQVTMAAADLNDGQRLLAFNDLFIGPSSHTSARYRITFREQSEDQSSSGIIVSTGAGSTGWMSSLFNMARGMEDYLTGHHQIASCQMPWDTDHLLFVVREPFMSKTSQVNLCAGSIEAGYQLEIESYMPDNGIIFSDGIESDFLRFNAGATVHIGMAQQKAKLVVL